VATAVGNVRPPAPLSRAVQASSTGRLRGDVRIVVPALVIGGAILAGMGLNVAPLTLAGALAAIVAGLVAPPVGLATIAFMGPLQPPMVIPSPPGFNAILVGAVVLGCVYRLPIDRPRIRLAAPILPLLGFVLYVWAQQTPEMVAGYAGESGHLAASQFAQLLTGFGAIVVAAYVLRGRSPYPFIAVGLASAVLAALLALVVSYNPEVGAPIRGLLAPTSIDQRGSGSFYNPNYFGVFEAIAIVTTVSWAIGTRSARVRILLLAACAVLGVGLALSLSRTGMIALTAGFVCLAFSRFRPRTAGMIAVGLLAAAIVLFPLFVQWRLNTTFGASSADAYATLAQSDAGRLSAILAGPQLFLTSPVFGVGWGQYSFMSAKFAGPGVDLAAHNWYINVLAEGGTVGIVLWILLLVAVAMALRSRPTFPRSTGFGVLGAYVAGSLFLEPPTSFQTSALPILVIVAALVSDWTAPSEAGRPPGDGEVPAPLGAQPGGRAHRSRAWPESRGAR